MVLPSVHNAMLSFGALGMEVLVPLVTQKLLEDGWAEGGSRALDAEDLGPGSVSYPAGW